MVMTETQVIKAFLRREGAVTDDFQSDGCQLCSGQGVIAQWGKDRIQIMSQNGDPARERRKDMLIEFILWEIQKGSLVQSLVKPTRLSAE